MTASFAISVPVGAYHPLLRDCLASLAIQNPVPRVALLDASGDPRVAAVADEFPDLITHRRHGPDGGQSDAIIEGWREIDGEILGWLNADDALYPGALEKAAAAFAKNKQADLVYGHSVIINDDNYITGYHWAVERPSENILRGGIISQPSCFFRRARYEAIGGLDRDLHYTMDWDLWVRFWLDGAKFEFIDDVLSRVLWTSDAKTGGFPKARQKELERIIASSGTPISRAKSRLGFALHHLFEYVMPGRVARGLRTQLGRNSGGVHGLGRNGEIANPASIPVIHYDQGNRTKIIIQLGGAFDGVRASIAPRTQTTSPKADGAIELTLDPPAKPGETMVIDLANEADAPARLEHIIWS